MKLKESEIREALWQAAQEFPLNRPQKTGYRPPLAAFASAAPEPFLALRKAGMPDHLLPQEAMPGCKSIIVYFFPYDEEIVSSNSGGQVASRRWAEAYLNMSDMLAKINVWMIAWLKERGINAQLAPKEVRTFDTHKLKSRWSNRHIAQIAGLGTFGKNNMLITKAGCCGQLSNILTDAEAEILPRPTEEFCLLYRNASCGACIAACPSKALHRDPEDPFDRNACYGRCLLNLQAVGCDVCGKCLAGMPCAMKKP